MCPLAREPRTERAMALRSFLDTKGVTWSVWTVVPQTQTGLVANPGHTQQAGPHLTPGLEQGWLCFESPHEKRRLTPIPADWEGCTEQEMERLLAAAVVVPKKRAPVIV